MLSRILHRHAVPTPTDEEKLARVAVLFTNMLDPLQKVSAVQLNTFVETIEPLVERPNGREAINTVFTRMAFRNGNTSYIEPFVEAAYNQKHYFRKTLADLYTAFVVQDTKSDSTLTRADSLVYKLLDERHYARNDFPVHCFSLLAQAGVKIPSNVQEKFLYRALVSNVPVEHLAPCINALGLNANTIKDKQQRTLLHSLMSDPYYRGTEELEHILPRAKQLGLQPSADIFGRYPDEFGTSATRLVYAQHFEAQTQENLSALAQYLQTTVHDFKGLQSVNARNTSVYLKQTTALNHARKTTLFEHVLASNNVEVISELQRLIAPLSIQHSDIDATLPYVFIENYVCSPNGKSDVAQAVFAMFQEESPKDLSTALGYFLMRSDKYYENYDVDARKLTDYPTAIQNILDYQAVEGLSDLLALETAKLDSLAPVVETAPAFSGGGVEHG